MPKILMATEDLVLKWMHLKKVIIVLVFEGENGDWWRLCLEEKLTAKAQKITIKLPWEITAVYSEVLRQSGHQSDDEEDEDDIEAHEASIQRLKVNTFVLRCWALLWFYDFVTRKQMKLHVRWHGTNINITQIVVRLRLHTVKVCVIASITNVEIIEKGFLGKRFREFLNLPPHLDLKQNDDTTDIVGFLAFEMVRALTIGGLNVKRALESRSGDSTVVLGKRKGTSGMEGPINKKARAESPDPFSDPVSTLFLPPPEARTALRAEHIQDSFSRMQRDWAHNRSSGMRNWRGGLIRTGIALI